MKALKKRWKKSLSDTSESELSIEWRIPPNVLTG